MTDNEIMKALRCCADKGCKFCSEQGKSYCRETVASLAWDLIYRQKAEVERLNELVVYNASCCTRLHKDLFNAKSEARKKFAERLCEGRVGNDPVVIAVKVELSEMEERE